MRVIVNPRMKSIAEVRELDQAAANSAKIAADRIFRQLARERFNSEGASGGSRWAPLSDNYKRAKDRLFSGAIAETQRVASARGRKLSKKGISKAIGSENKIMQLTGDTKRSFSRSGGDHLAEAIRYGKAWRIQLGAVGPEYAVYHMPEWVRSHPGRGMKARDLLQHRADQYKEYFGAIRKVLIPHVMKRFETLTRWRSAARG